TRPVDVSAMPSPEWPSAAMVTVSATPAAEQELAVAAAARYRRLDQAVDLPAGLRGEPAGDTLGRGSRDADGPDDAAFAKRRRATLELRLDQEPAPRPRAGKSERRRQGKFQRDEAQVGDDRVGRPGEVGVVETADVHSLARNHARIASERVVE